jgi:hypothetical protein
MRETGIEEKSVLPGLIVCFVRTLLIRSAPTESTMTVVSRLPVVLQVKRLRCVEFPNGPRQVQKLPSIACVGKSIEVAAVKSFWRLDVQRSQRRSDRQNMLKLRSAQQHLLGRQPRSCGGVIIGSDDL